MNPIDYSLKNPYVITALGLLVVAMGLISFFRIPTDLFPDTVPPQVVVITIQPGAAAKDIVDKVTRVIEKELNTLSGLKKITSLTRDGVSSINVEFHYEKPVPEAVQEVQSAVNRIRAILPENILEPRIYKITDETKPLLTLALYPKKGSTKTLFQIRLVAENQIKDAILALPGIADVQMVGGHSPEVKINIKRDRLAANKISMAHVITALARQNIAAPAGFIYTKQSEYLIKITGEFTNLQQIKRFPIQKRAQGYLRIGDVASVTLGEQERRSLYHGNGIEGIALNIIRTDNEATLSAIRTFKSFLPSLKSRFPDIVFEITDDQQPSIDININGMRQALLQAAFLTIIVVFIFLADFRAAIAVSVSVPLAFLASFCVLWLSPYTLNMVILTALIVSVGMVVDASIVVLENIYRVHQTMETPDAMIAANKGSREVSLAVTAGILTTVVVFIPVMFTKGFTRQTLRPLSIMIVSTLIASLVVALSVIPLITSRLLRENNKKRNIIERLFGYTNVLVNGVAHIYLFILRKALRWRIVVIILSGAFFFYTMKIVPKMIGGELMTPMDTGIVIMELDTYPNYSVSEVNRVINEVESIIYRQPGIKMVSSVAGSEPGQISFGRAATLQSVTIKIQMVDRKQRKENIWTIIGWWREKLRAVKGLQSYRITEYGSTPISTTKAPLDIIISGPDSKLLNQLAFRCMQKLRGIPGLIDVRRSWYLNKHEHRVIINPELALLYNTTVSQVARELDVAIKGVTATHMRLTNFLDIPITVQYYDADLDQPNRLSAIYVSSAFGPVPLRSLAKIKYYQEQPFITREGGKNTIDITGGNNIYTIAQVAQMVKKRISKMQLPAGYAIEISGNISNMKESKKEMGRALIIGFFILYFLLLAIFKSFSHPITIMAAIPLAIAGAMWGLLLFDKPMCKPAKMGLILLGGTIINNSILLLDFILTKRMLGVAKKEAIIEAVKLRIRPILMTTVSTIVGLTPLVFEMAVGLERLSPLGVVAASGLAVGTFLTIIVIPVIYSLMDTFVMGIIRLWIS